MSTSSFNLLEEMCKYLDVVLHWHGDEPYNLPTEPIDCTNMRYSEHHQFIVLVDVHLMAIIVSSASVVSGMHAARRLSND